VAAQLAASQEALSSDYAFSGLDMPVPHTELKSLTALLPLTFPISTRNNQISTI
jgi:hypothetical protein